MRNLLNNISTIGKLNIRRGISMLIVRNEVVRSLSARSLAALAWCMSWMSGDMRGIVERSMAAMHATSVVTHGVPCFATATVKQPVRQRQVVRYRSIG